MVSHSRATLVSLKVRLLLMINSHRVGLTTFMGEELMIGIKSGNTQI